MMPEPMNLRSPKGKMICFRVSDAEYHAAAAEAQRQDERSVSSLARATLIRHLKQGSVESRSEILDLRNQVTHLSSELLRLERLVVEVRQVRASA